MVAAFAPYGWWPGAVIGVGLLAIALRGVRPGLGAWLGFVHGLVFFLPLLHWASTYVGSPPWVALAVLEASYLALLGAVGAMVLTLRAGPVWFAAAWVAQEALRARWPLGGFGWGRLAFSQADAPTAALASLGGAPLVSFTVALAGALLGIAVVGGVRQTMARRGLAALAAAGLLAVGLVVPRAVDGPKVDVAVIQGNVPRLGLDFNAQRAAVLANHVQATKQLANEVAAGQTHAPEVVVWPENSSDIDPYTDPAAARAIEDAASAVGVPILVGAVVDGPGEYLSNTAIVWDGQDGPGQRYIKRHPVPFAEWIPARSFFQLLSPYVDRVHDFAPGEGVAPLQLGSAAAAAPVICFEVVDDELVRSAVASGANLITVQTNSATFGYSPESAQQLAMSRLRALEHGRTVLSASTSGISAIILPDGRVEAQSGIFTQEVLTATVPLRDEVKWADRVGAWPEWIIVAGALGALATALVHTSRRRRVVLSAPGPRPGRAGTPIGRAGSRR
jgi:apolipoprotein N-acyltransferase